MKFYRHKKKRRTIIKLVIIAKRQYRLKIEENKAFGKRWASEIERLQTKYPDIRDTDNMLHNMTEEDRQIFQRLLEERSSRYKPFGFAMI